MSGLLLGLHAGVTTPKPSMTLRVSLAPSVAFSSMDSFCFWRVSGESHVPLAFITIPPKWRLNERASLLNYSPDALVLICTRCQKSSRKVLKNPQTSQKDRQADHFGFKTECRSRYLDLYIDTDTLCYTPDAFTDQHIAHQYIYSWVHKSLHPLHPPSLVSWLRCSAKQKFIFF